MHKYLLSLLLLVTAFTANAKTIDLNERGALAANGNRVHILYFSASYCSYCERLEAEVINPMRKNANYRKQVLITQLAIDGGDLVVDFDNNTTDADKLSSRLSARVTPTLLFLNHQGEEIAERVVGFQNPEFYWYYLDEAIASALTALGHAAPE